MRWLVGIALSFLAICVTLAQISNSVSPHIAFSRMGYTALVGTIQPIKVDRAVLIEKGLDTNAAVLSRDEQSIEFVFSSANTSVPKQTWFANGHSYIEFKSLGGPIDGIRVDGMLVEWKDGATISYEANAVLVPVSVIKGESLLIIVSDYYQSEDRRLCNLNIDWSQPALMTNYKVLTLYFTLTQKHKEYHYRAAISIDTYGPYVKIDVIQTPLIPF